MMTKFVPLHLSQWLQVKCPETCCQIIVIGNKTACFSAIHECNTVQNCRILNKSLENILTKSHFCWQTLTNKPGASKAATIVREDEFDIESNID